MVGVNMKNNKEVLKYCPNFYRIVNFDYSCDDYISEKLISIYEDYIFKIDLANLEEIELAGKIDRVLSKYIEDYAFRKELRKELVEVRIKKSCTDILKAIVESVINIFTRYEEYTTRHIYISRWI